MFHNLGSMSSLLFKMRGGIALPPPKQWSQIFPSLLPVSGRWSFLLLDRNPVWMLVAPASFHYTLSDPRALCVWLMSGFRKL